MHEVIWRSFLSNVSDFYVNVLSGIDATTDFEDVGHSSDARELKKRYLIGTVTDKPVSGLVETVTDKPVSSLHKTVCNHFQREKVHLHCNQFLPVDVSVTYLVHNVDSMHFPLCSVPQAFVWPFFSVYLAVKYL